MTFDERFAAAVQAFWDVRAAQMRKQQESGKVDAGSRGAVTGGAQMDRMTALLEAESRYQRPLGSALLAALLVVLAYRQARGRSFRPTSRDLGLMTSAYLTRCWPPGWPTRARCSWPS